MKGRTLEFISRTRLKPRCAFRWKAQGKCAVSSLVSFVALLRYHL